MQVKDEESKSGIPSDDWLDSRVVSQAKRKHLELLGLTSLKPRGLCVLDAGCGPGTYGIILAECGFEVSGIDISKAAVDKANERAAKRHLNFHASTGDLEHLDFEDGTFDIVFVGWALHHFPSLDKVVAEICRVLKPGGRIAIVEPNEANIVARFSRLVEDMLQSSILKVGWDTPNRTLHFYNDYLRQLQKCGITNLQYSSCFAKLPPIVKSDKSGFSTFMKIMYHARTLIFSTSTRLLPRPLNGQDLLIGGSKTV